jgi:hypothetical protein
MVVVSAANCQPEPRCRPLSATRSWFYTVELPGFAIFTIAGWWHLIHEDPEAYRARKQRPAECDGALDG